MFSSAPQGIIGLFVFQRYIDVCWYPFPPKICFWSAHKIMHVNKVFVCNIFCLSFQSTIFFVANNQIFTVCQRGVEGIELPWVSPTTQRWLPAACMHKTHGASGLVPLHLGNPVSLVRTHYIQSRANSTQLPQTYCFMRCRIILISAFTGGGIGLPCVCRGMQVNMY